MKEANKLWAFLPPLFRGIPKFPFRISKRERGFLIGGAVVSCFILLYQFAFNPILDQERNIRQEIAVKQKILSNYRNVAKRKGELTRNISYLKLRLKDTETKLLDGTNPSLAAANLQEIINQICSQNEVSITSVRVLPPSSIDMYTEIPIRIETKGTIAGVKNFLYEIENCPKLLAVKEMNVYVPRSPRRRPRPEASARTASFRTSLVVVGFIK